MNDTELLLTSVMDMAQQMMVCGAEVGRVDSTIRHICGAYGFNQVETFTITSLITATVTEPDGTRVSQSRCIGKYSTDMEKLEQLNAMSRDICKNKPEIEDIPKRLASIDREPAMNFWRHLIGNCLMAVGFSIFFGGNLRDALASALVAVLITLADRLCRGKSPNPLIYTAICSIFAGLAGIALVKIGIGVNADKVMIGDIMIFIPGLQMVNSIRDLLSGNTITGTLKLVEVVLTAVAIAVGFGAALLIFGGAA